MTCRHRIHRLHQHGGGLGVVEPRIRYADGSEMARARVVATVALLAVAVDGFSVTPYPASVLRSPLARHHAGHVQRARELVTRKAWIENCDTETGECFYYNDETGESQWEPPPGFQVGGAAPPGGAMTGGWVALVDEGSGETYYFNEQTGASQWDPPQQAAATGQAQQAASTRPLWRLAPYTGVCGFSGVSGFAAEAKYDAFVQEFENSDVTGRPCQLPYKLGVGDERMLSRWNMINQKLTVDRAQALIECFKDGTATLTGKGDRPTLWANPGGQWTPIEKEVSVQLSHGDLVSLDASDPDGAVFVVEQA